MAFRKAYVNALHQLGMPYPEAVGPIINRSGRELAFLGSLCSITPPGDSYWVCGISGNIRTLSSSDGKADGVQYVWPVPQVGHSHLMEVLQGEDVGVW